MVMVTSSFQLEQSKDGVTFAWTERTVEEEQDGAASWENVGLRCLLDTRVKNLWSSVHPGRMPGDKMELLWQISDISSQG